MRRVYKTASARLAPNFLSDSDNFGTLLLNIEDVVSTVLSPSIASEIKQPSTLHLIPS